MKRKKNRKSIYPNMNELLTEGGLGRFYIEKFTIEKNNPLAIKQGVPEGDYTRLLRVDTSNNISKATCVMSNTPMELETNKHFVNTAHGNVLIAGLGMGMILMAIQDNKSINSITIIEKYEDVINLIGSQLNFNNMVKIINADIFEWLPESDTKYDTIYLDIWDKMNVDSFKEIDQLKQKFKPYINAENSSSYIRSWMEEDYIVYKQLSGILAYKNLDTELIKEFIESK